MWIKRYGYKKPPSDGAGVGLFGMTLILLLSAAISAVPAIFFLSPWPFLLIFPIGVYVTSIVDTHMSKEGDRRRAKRFQMHISQANGHILEKDTLSAIECLRRAKIYADLPENLEQYWQANTKDNAPNK